MLSDFDLQMLLRAERLAMNGRGKVEPNPMVGCVLVRGETVIGEGWHVEFGKGHAEPTALADCASRGNSAKGATAYVTLEPCCHTNKKTPPCAPRLIEAGIARVVIGCLDPNPDVNGKGVAMLRAAGIEVDTLPPPPLAGEGRGGGLGELQSSLVNQGPPPQPSPASGGGSLNASRFRQLIAPFIARIEARRLPIVTLKWAETADGFVAGAHGVRVAITNDTSNRLVHQLRSRHGAIAVGINTVIADDPLLTVRGIDGANQPIRVVLDSTLRIPTNAKLLKHDPNAGRVVVMRAIDSMDSASRVATLKQLGVEVATFERRGDHLHLPKIDARTDEWLVESGPTLARSFLPWADRLWVFRSPSRLHAGDDAPRAATIPDHWIATGTLDVHGDQLTEYVNTKSVNFHAAVPSADFVLAREQYG
jgi:diaminohydroxyphosphoribosylaminopyrimidine deaminase/5-amino-6-(5-phosphoribosylamino)uracil reductase